MIPALTPDGARRALDKRGLWMANGNYEGGATGTGLDWSTDRPMQERCLGWTVAGPPMIPGAYNNNVGIFQTSDQVVILNEMVHDHRIIPLDARPRVGEAIRLWMGSSRARWDGDTLVVSTTNFRPMVFRSASDKFALTEKFTLVDGDTLMYKFTVDDPMTWVRPWTVQFPMIRSHEPIYGTRATKGTTACGTFCPLRGNRSGRAISQRGRTPEEQPDCGHINFNTSTATGGSPTIFTSRPAPRTSVRMAFVMATHPPGV